MLLTQGQIEAVLTAKGITLAGILHLGAFECEERGVYNALGVTDENIVWVEAQADIVAANVANGVPNVFQAVLDETTGVSLKLNIASDKKASSTRMYQTHWQHYNTIYLVNTLDVTTVSIPDFLEANNLASKEFTLLKLDLQGAELDVLKGGVDTLPTLIYTRFHTEKVFDNCGQLEDIDTFLASAGFTRELTSPIEYGWGEALYVKSI
jgi:FkbM family methyltransferase